MVRCSSLVHIYVVYVLGHLLKKKWQDTKDFVKISEVAGGVGVGVNININMPTELPHKKTCFVCVCLSCGRLVCGHCMT